MLEHSDPQIFPVIVGCVTALIVIPAACFVVGWLVRRFFPNLY